jgi:large subunit ribosomal protein L32e
MTTIKELLELRKQIKNKKPNFIRQDTHKKKRLSRTWRKPKGLHSKLRLKHRGRAKPISQGYRSPKKVKHLHKNGLQECIIRSINDLRGLDNKKSGLIISSALGNKKKIIILKKAKELGLNVLNIKGPDEYIKNVEDKINLRKKIKEEEKAKLKETKKDEKGIDKENKKENVAEKVSNEQEKDIEKKETDKTLIKKEK